MKAKVDQDLCSGCGLCEEVCPEVFKMGDDDIAKVKVETVPPEAEQSCRDAADQCPSEAISIDESCG
mgnify:CR=1 FL=1